MKRRLTLIAMTLVNSLRSSRPTGMRKSLALTLILTLVLVPLLSHRTLLPSAQAQIGTCGGAGRIFQGCPLGGLFEAGLENQAIDQLIALHKLPAADRSRILGWERDKVRALLYGKLLDVIKKAPTSRSADEQTAVDALAARIKQKRLEAAQYAIDEYNKWDASPCAYAPPTGFSYNPGAPCYLPLQAFFQGRPDPPKFEEFQAYGVARAYNELNSPDAQRVAAASARAAQFFGGVAAAGIAGAIGVAIAASLPQTAIAVIFPFAFGIASSTFAGSAGVAGGATAAATGLTSATVALGGAVAIVVVAIVIGVLRGIDVFNAAAIPGKLQETKNNVMNTAVDLAQVITTEHGQQEVYAMFIVMTLPDFLSSDPVPAQQASDPKFMLQRSGSPTTADYLLRYKSWDNADQTARLNGGWFINKDAGGKEVWTLSIDYLDWNGEQWTASRSGTNFIHTKEGAADRTFESPQIKYKDWSGINFTASLGVTALEIDALPVVLNRGHINPNDKFDPDPFPQTLPVALVNSAGQALNTLSVMVNDAASAATTGVTIANLSVDSAGQVTASLAATCAASSATFMLKVTDSQGQSKTTPLVIYLTPIYGAPRNPLPATLPDGKVGVPYGAVLMPDLIVACNARATIHHTGGKLPFGLSFGDVRSCSGIFCIEQGFGVTSTPTSGGSSTFTVTMSFSNGDTFSRTYTVNIASDPVEMPAGMVSWWNAEHGVQDIAERNHGQASNGFGPKDFAIGHVGLAFRFNGSSGAVRLPNNFFPFPASGAGNTPFTFETWFKTSSGGVIIGEQSSLPGGAIPSSDSFSPGIYVGMDGKLRARMFSPGVIAPITSDATVNDDRFHHVAVTYDGMEQAVYLDGDEIGRVPHSHPGVDRFYAYQLGTGYTTGWPSANNGWFGFNGLIDEATFFSRALDAQEVRAIFGAGQAGKILFNLNVTNPLCRGDANGTVQINVKGGFGALSYSMAIDVIHGGGTNFQPSNFFSGLPAGAYPFVGVRDSRGYEFGKAVILTDPEIISLSPSSLAATANLGQPFTQNFQASGGTGKKTLTLSGALPGGLTFTNDPANSAGTISGAPTQSGSWIFTLTATDQNGCARNQSYTLVTNASPTITAASPISRQQGATGIASTIGAVDDDLTAAGSLNVSVTSAPAGITVTGITNSNGVITANVAASCAAALGPNTVGLKVTDGGGLTATASLTVNVTASNPPAITLNPAISLFPPNHSYRTVTVAQMVQSVTDDCDTSLINSVVIEKVTSDEPDNAPGDGDGNTTNDIVIAPDCKSVQLRAERDETKNGRVYVITLRVRDVSGNTTRADYKAHAPVDLSIPAIQDAAARTLTSGCP